MATVFALKATGIPGHNPALFGLSTKNPIAEVETTFPQKSSVEINATNFISRIDILEHSPYKVTFIQVTDENYFNRGNVAPVGIAVIGYSNYIG